MRRVLFALLLIILAIPSWVRAQPGIIGPPNAIVCNNIYGLSAGFSGPTQIVAASTTGQRVLICGWQVTVSGGANSNFQVITGTGTNCANNSVPITPAFNVGSTPLTTTFGYAVAQTPQNYALCVNVSSSNTAVVIWGTQQ